MKKKTKVPECTVITRDGLKYCQMTKKDLESLRPILDKKTFSKYSKIYKKDTAKMTKAEWLLFMRVIEATQDSDGLIAKKMDHRNDYKEMVKMLVPTLKNLGKYKEYLGYVNNSDVGWVDKRDIAKCLILDVKPYGRLKRIMKRLPVTAQRL